MTVFQRISQQVGPDKSFGKLDAITVRVYITDCTGAICITDLLLQGGSSATGWVGHPCEIRWTLDG